VLDDVGGSVLTWRKKNKEVSESGGSRIYARESECRFTRYT